MGISFHIFFFESHKKNQKKLLIFSTVWENFFYGSFWVLRRQLPTFFREFPTFPFEKPTIFRGFPTVLYAFRFMSFSLLFSQRWFFRLRPGAAGPKIRKNREFCLYLGFSMWKTRHSRIADGARAEFPTFTPSRNVGNLHFSHIFMPNSRGRFFPLVPDARFCVFFVGNFRVSHIFAP